MPAFNGSAHLSQAIESAREQTFSDFELLIVDDHSSDDTHAIAEHFATRDPRVRVHRNPVRLGSTANWNRCLELASGKWIKFLFQDDYLRPACVERLLQVGEDSKATLVACQRDFDFDEALTNELRHSFLLYVVENDLAGRFPKHSGVISAEEFAAHTALYPALNCIGEPTAVMFHRSVIERFGRFNPDLTQLADWEYWMRIVVNTGLHYLDESLATFRVNRRRGTFANMESPLLLDQLIIYHELVYNQRYLAVREAVQQKGLGIDLKHKLFTLCRSLKARSGGEPAGRQQRLVLSPEDWKRVVKRYPRLRFPRLHYLIAKWMN